MSKRNLNSHLTSLLWVLNIPRKKGYTVEHYIGDCRTNFGICSHYVSLSKLILQKSPSRTRHTQKLLDACICVKLPLLGQLPLGSIIHVLSWHDDGNKNTRNTISRCMVSWTWHFDVWSLRLPSNDRKILKSTKKPENRYPFFSPNPQPIWSLIDGLDPPLPVSVSPYQRLFGSK